MMYKYNAFQRVGFFAVYCFIGWLFESIFVSVKSKYWVNRGFLNGPFLPIYGFGAIIMLLCALPVRNNLFLVFLFGMLGATALEYFTGWVLEKIFHVKYWDYSEEPLNVNGYICLGCSLMWGMWSLLLICFIHKPVERIMLGVDSTLLVVLDCIFAFSFVSDIVVSAKQAFDLRMIVDEMIKQNEYVLRAQRRLDVLIAFASSDVEKLHGKWEDAKADFRERVSEFQENRQEKRTEREAEIARIKEEIASAMERYNIRIEKYRKNARRILKRNPNTVSKKHRVEFDDLKQLLRRKN